MNKIRNKERTCRYCDRTFLAADVKASVCPKCKESPALLGTCENCGRPCKKTNRFCSKKCSTTFIHKTEPYRVGAQKGDANISKRSDVRKKISEGVTRSYDNPDLLSIRAKAMAALGSKKGFRSKQEEEFSCFLKDQSIEFLREVPTEYQYVVNGKVKTRHKVVDFIIPSIKTNIELTGFIWGSTDPHHRYYFRERLLELASENTDQYYIISSNEPKVVDKIREFFDGYHPWNINEMRLGDNLLILSYEELKKYVKEKICK